MIALETSPMTDSHIPHQASSLLTRLFEEARLEGDMHISFEDLTGILLDNPDIRLPYRFRIHTCDFCLHAKNSPNSHQHCVRNKMAANRVALWKRETFLGQCHLGLSELVKPLLFRENVMGVFYYGSFVLEGTEALTQKRIRTFCSRHGFDPEGYLLTLAKAPRISSDQIPELWRKLDLISDLTRTIIENIGVPVDRYRTRSGSQFATWNTAMPSLVRNVVTFINHNYSTPLRITKIAEIHRCNPDYLSRVFKRTVGIKLLEYIHRVRMDHAKRLLLSDRFSAGEIGFLVGFEDHSHFGKVFRKTIGKTPQEYRESAKTTDSKIVEGESHSQYSTFEYSNIRPFNPQFGGPPSNNKQMLM